MTMHEKKYKGRDKAREMEGDASTYSAAEVEADEDGNCFVGGVRRGRGMMGLRCEKGQRKTHPGEAF